eukprot:5040540-Prymnesium_polylepis.1
MEAFCLSAQDWEQGTQSHGCRSTVGWRAPNGLGRLFDSTTVGSALLVLAHLLYPHAIASVCLHTASSPVEDEAISKLIRLLHQHAEGQNGERDDEHYDSHKSDRHRSHELVLQLIASTRHEHRRGTRVGGKLAIESIVPILPARCQRIGPMSSA